MTQTAHNNIGNITAALAFVAVAMLASLLYFARGITEDVKATHDYVIRHDEKIQQHNDRITKLEQHFISTPLNPTSHD